MTKEELFYLPYGCTNGIARRTAVSAGEPHDHHCLRGHSQTTLRYPHGNNFVVKPNDECGSVFGMMTSFKILSASGYSNNFTSFPIIVIVNFYCVAAKLRN